MEMLSPQINPINYECLLYYALDNVVVSLLLCVSVFLSFSFSLKMLNSLCGLFSNMSSAFFSNSVSNYTNHLLFAHSLLWLGLIVRGLSDTVSSALIPLHLFFNFPFLRGFLLPWAVSLSCFLSFSLLFSLSSFP